jgi:hypothetical protein
MAANSLLWGCVATAFLLYVMHALDRSKAFFKVFDHLDRWEQSLLMRRAEFEVRLAPKPVRKVAWMPEPDGEPSFINLHPQARQLVGAVEAVRGQPMDGETYLSLLAGRVQRMLERAEDSDAELHWLYSILSMSGLAEDKPELEEAGNELVFNNWLVRERLYLMRVPGPLPKTLEDDDPHARAVLNETDAQRWADALTSSPTEPDR